jgi:hypothetical protein
MKNQLSAKDSRWIKRAGLSMGRKRGRGLAAGYKTMAEKKTERRKATIA